MKKTGSGKRNKRTPGKEGRSKMQQGGRREDEASEEREMCGVTVGVEPSMC